jgi:uncharacterized protein YprB with RNaseH-like and TPR domain
VFVAEAHRTWSDHHGQHALVELEQVDATRWASVLFQPPEPFDVRGALFLDTETTGLGRGPGTFCFMVGTARREAQGIQVRQYLAPDYGDEALLLELLEHDLAATTGVVTFNGRTFDLPLLETRYVLNGYARTPLYRVPHLDLLPVARRLWRRFSPSCALSALETGVLGVVRDSLDIPGYLIPDIYRQYQMTGDPREMEGIFYHNKLDVLSMVTLLVHADGSLDPQRSRGGGAHHDPLAVGRLHEADAAAEEALEAYRRAASSADPLVQREARQRLGALLKRQGRLSEAAAVWQDALQDGVLYPYVELAKYYEHHLRSYAQAQGVVQSAVRALASGWIADADPHRAMMELASREARLAIRQANAARRGGSGTGSDSSTA